MIVRHAVATTLPVTLCAGTRGGAESSSGGSSVAQATAPRA